MSTKIVRIVHEGTVLARYPHERSSKTGENHGRVSGGIGGWHDVMYDSGLQQQIIRDFIATSLEIVDETYGAGLMVSRDSRFLATLAPTMRHQTFVEEQGIRFVASKLNDMRENLRAGDFGIIPHVEVAKATDRQSFVDSPVKSPFSASSPCGAR